MFHPKSQNPRKSKSVSWREGSAAPAENIKPVTADIPEDWDQMWQAAQVGHAAANNVYVAAVNRVGTEDAMKFWGGSFIADPGGRVLAKADDTEQIVLADCNFDHVKRMQASWRFLKERKPDMYGKLLENQT